MSLYKKKNHAVSALYAHVVLTIKYRRPALSEPDIARTVIVSIRRTALMLNCEIEAIESDANHLHILLHWPPSISLSTLIQQIKGRSAREVRINERQNCVRNFGASTSGRPVIASYHAAVHRSAS